MIRNVARIAVARDVHGTREFKRAVSLIGNHTRNPDAKRRKRSINGRILEIRSFKESDLKQCWQGVAHQSPQGAFDTYGLSLSRVPDKVWSRFVDALMRPDCDAALGQLLSEHGGRLPGLGLAAFSSTAFLFRPDLYMVWNRRSWFGDLNRWVDNDQYDRLVPMCIHLRKLCDLSGFPKQSRFAILDGMLESLPKTGAPFHPGHRDQARRAVQSWLDLKWNVANTDVDDLPLNQETSGHPEGADRLALHRRRERMNRGKLLELMQRRHGSIPSCCDVCGINPTLVYARMAFVLDVHHIVMLKHGVRNTMAEDLVMLCPNCHRGAHVWMSRHLTEGHVASEYWQAVHAEYRERAQRCLKSAKRRKCWP